MSENVETTPPRPRGRPRGSGQSDGRPHPLREALKAAAVKLFPARGYAVVTVDDIVREVGVTKGAFYHHFDSKGELLFELHNEFVSHSLSRYRQVLAHADGPEGKVAAFVREVFTQIHESHDYVGVLFDERRSLPAERVEEVERKKDEVRKLLENVIDEGIAAGVFRPVDRGIAGLAIFGMCLWGYQWYQPNGPLSHEELGDQFAALALNALAASPR